MVSPATIKYATEGMILLVLAAFVLLLVLRPKPASKKALKQEGLLNPDHKLYEPYKRVDQYGLLGAEPQPLLEYGRLAVLAVTLVPIKFTGAFLSVLTLNLMCRYDLYYQALGSFVIATLSLGLPMMQAEGP